MTETKRCENCANANFTMGKGLLHWCRKKKVDVSGLLLAEDCSEFKPEARVMINLISGVVKKYIHCVLYIFLMVFISLKMAALITLSWWWVASLFLIAPIAGYIGYVIVIIYIQRQYKE